MKVALLLLVVCLASTASAEESQFRLMDSDGFNFVAPSVPGTSSVADKQVGIIVYDSSSDQLKVLDRSGNWDSMSNPGNNQNVSSSYSGQLRIETASATSTCTSGTCTLAFNTPGISNIQWNGSNGHYIVHFVNGTFTQSPVCHGTAMANAGANYIGNDVGGGPTTSQWAFFTAAPVTGYNNDGFMITCTGPH